MSRAGFGGAGGYGGISTMNQDDRQGPYYPHHNISKHTDHATDEVQVFCFSCGQRWWHKRGEIEKPERCAKS